MTAFNLYREAKDNYERLIPDRAEGLILLSLFEKFGEDTFSEEQIIDVINFTLRDLGNSSNRIEYERNNKLIIRFQEYFLWRDEIRRSYRLKKYAVDFCSRISKKLEEAYNPAKIKRWFDELLNKLEQQHLEKNGFELWVEDDWEWRHTILAEQIEILDNQVIESVKEFKIQIRKNGDTNGIIDLLKGIELRLELVKNQATELTQAFQATYEIDDILTKILEQGHAYGSLKKIKKVREFNQSVRSHLEQISKRIEKIKPRIREFIYDFNRRDYDRNSEKFLSYILTNSKVDKRQSSGFRFVLPSDIPYRRISNFSVSPKFIIIPVKQIGPKKISTPHVRKVDFSRREILINKAKAWKHEKERISFWVKRSREIVNSNGFLDFTEIFFQILKIEKGNLSIAVKTAHKVIRNSLKNDRIAVKISQEKQTDPMFKNISIWKMEITMI